MPNYIDVRFLLITEGSSDKALVAPLERLCLYCGADNVYGRAFSTEELPFPIDNNVGARLEVVFNLPDINFYNIVFVHKDADERNHLPSYTYITNKVTTLGISEHLCIPLVPVQETEAWALLDEGAIRFVAENPFGYVNLNLPSAATVERIARPKERLLEILTIASEITGSKLVDFREKYNYQREALLERLEADDPIKDVPAWQRLVTDVRNALEAL